MTGRRTFIGGAIWLALVMLSVQAALAAGLDRPLARTFLLGDPQIEPAGDSLEVITPGVARGTPGLAPLADDHHGRNTKIIGCSLFSSGLFLCSWGISSWQFEDDQCCPARNTENAIKIIVGVVMVNAGMFYLLGGAD